MGSHTLCSGLPHLSPSHGAKDDLTFLAHQYRHSCWLAMPLLPFCYPQTCHHVVDCTPVCLVDLQSLSGQLRSRELSLADAESQLAAKDEALAAAGQETSNMHKVWQGFA